MVAVPDLFLKDGLRTELRFIRKPDIPEVMQIEKASYICPWTEKELIRCLSGPKCIGILARRGMIPVAVGFMVYKLRDTFLEIMNLAVHPSYRRIGVGRTIVSALCGTLTTTGPHTIITAVRETNVGAQLFLKACGFRATDILKGICPHSDEDAYLMQYRTKGIQGDAANTQAG